MKSRRMKSRQTFSRFLNELGADLPSEERYRLSSERVLENLSLLDISHTGESNECGAPNPVRALGRFQWLPAAAMAAVLFAAAVLVGTLSAPERSMAVAQRLNGKLTVESALAIRPGQVVRTDGSAGAVLVLRDGSHVEMSAGVELSIDQAADGLQIDLARGNVIVTAARQHDGHLYVKTRDCIVSVVGTVFSVKAEAAGSRVAVIEGKVHVQHGDVSQTLLPGQQVSTSAALQAVPLQSEIGWSQDAATHIAMLQQSNGGNPVPTQTEIPVMNPDLVGELRVILSPVPQVPSGDRPKASDSQAPGYWLTTIPAGQGDTGPVTKKMFFFSLGIQLDALTAPAKAGIFRYYSVAQNTNDFSFQITGIQGRTVSFTNDIGESFSYGCADCSFFVSEGGVAKTSSNLQAGIEFKLSVDGSQITVTCHASQCLHFQQRTDTIPPPPNGRYRLQYRFVNQANPDPQSFTIPVSGLSPQSDRSTVFIVTK